MFYLIGLGLGDAKDVTINGLETIKQAKNVYLEAYTSILTVRKEQLEMLYGREVILADREMVEQGSDKILTDAATENVAFLVVGDPVGATTHMDLMLRAQENGIECRIIHNASIMTAVGCCGLQLYNFGETVSIVFWTETWKPESFYDKIIANRTRGLHTLCLLDIKMKEQTIENLMRGRKIYEPPRFMTVSQAAKQLIEIIENQTAAGDTDTDEIDSNPALSADTLCVGLARVGAEDQIVATGTLKEFFSTDLGGPLHSLIIPGKMHPLEKDMLTVLSKRHQENHPAQKGDSGEKQKTGFYLIGLGLGNSKDITVKGLEIVQRAKRVFLEAYTSTLTTGKEALEEFYGRDIILADREMVEQNSDELLADADSAEIAFLVVGDPVGATTHTDLMLRSLEKGIKCQVIHNASIMHAVGCCGLQLYNFGETVSIVFWTDSWRPDSFYDKLIANRKQGLHTLCLLDIKMKEQTIENMMRGRKIFEPPRFMSVSQAAEQLLEIIQNRDGGADSAILTADTVCIGLARIGSENQRVITSTLHRLASYDLGPPLHTLVIPGHCHPLEVDMLLRFAEDDRTREQLSKLK